ncbi:MAG: RNA polymerase subunit sigma-70 [Solirubrobacterales bacterium]|nr:RNA polymerase subunit sigma-70 [Solirubrobacterales bacterium]
MRRSLPAPGEAAIRAGDEAAFVAAVERHRREPRVHCYRMLGSLEESEDLVQETALRAWRGRHEFEGRASARAWLYAIATNACLDVLRRRPARVLPVDVAAPSDPTGALPARADLPWLEPYPDHLLEGVAPEAEGPDAIAVANETLELAFLAAIQHLTPRRRAVLILRDVLDWPARDTAAALAMSVNSVNSTLQRARATLRDHLPRRRAEWTAGTPSASERALVGRYMDAHERGDVAALAGLLREDARVSAPPLPLWFDGREACLASARRLAAPGRFRYVATAANRQPAAASYVRRDGDGTYRPRGIDVLTIAGGLVVEVTAFLRPDLFAAFGLPAAL